MSIVKAGQKIGQGAVKRSWPFYSRMFISIQGYTKIILGLYLIHKRRNVKFKIYLELSYFCATYPTLTRNRGRHRPYIHIKSTPAGQQLPYKTKLHVKKTRGGAYLAPPPSPRPVRVKKTLDKNLKF